MGRPRKYEAIADDLTQRISRGVYATGEALPPERALASDFEVTRLTLRKAIDRLVAEGVLRRQQGRGTFVARNGSASERAGSLLYVGPVESHFFQAFYTQLSAWGQQRATSVVAVTPAGGGDEAASERLRHHLAGGEAVVCLSTEWGRIRQLAGSDVCVVRISGFGSFEPASARAGDRGAVISTDTFRAGKLACGHLLSQGHRRIGLMDAGLGSVADLEQRALSRHAPYLGYRAALSEVGIDAVYPISVPDQQVGAGWQDADYAAARQCLQDAADRPTAVVCVGDFRAGPLIRAAQDLGLRVPGDLSVIGMGNTPWARWLNPPLTSVSMGEQEIARLALMFAAEPEASPQTVVYVAPQLVSGDSVAPPSGGG